MIIVKLMGGLGNQMFQYAAARRLALAHNTEVALDCSYFDITETQDTVRKYELGKFPICARQASTLEIAELSGSYKNFIQRSLIALRRTCGMARIPAPVYESHIGFNPDILNCPDNVYLCGYWQSERYFSDIAETILNELTPTDEIADEILDVSKQIRNSNSVAVHFRRGDYVNNHKSAAFHGVLPISYYENALQHITESLAKPELFVFSDEPEWVRKEIQFPYPAHIIDSNPERPPYQDMRLMSLCNHAIIANSSFSWWGAWMIRNPDKIVIAPERWLIKKHVKTVDLLPESWIKLS